MSYSFYPLFIPPLKLYLLRGANAIQLSFEFPHFLSPHTPQSAILKYLNKVICCDLTFGRQEAADAGLSHGQDTFQGISDCIKKTAEFHKTFWNIPIFLQ